MNDNREKFRASAIAHPIYRLFALILPFYLITCLLGFGFILAGHGLLFGFIWLAPYWKTSRAILAKWMNVPLKESPLKFQKRGFQYNLLIIFQWIYLIVKMAVSLFLIYYGALMIFHGGFMKQNVLWMLFVHR